MGEVWLYVYEGWGVDIGVATIYLCKCLSRLLSFRLVDWLMPYCSKYSLLWMEALVS